MSTEQQTLEGLAKRVGIVLLYHGTFSAPPAALAQGLHNVPPVRNAFPLFSILAAR